MHEAYDLTKRIVKYVACVTFLAIVFTATRWDTIVQTKKNMDSNPKSSFCLWQLAKKTFYSCLKQLFLTLKWGAEVQPHPKTPTLLCLLLYYLSINLHSWTPKGTLSSNQDPPWGGLPSQLNANCLVPAKSLSPGVSLGTSKGGRVFPHAAISSVLLTMQEKLLLLRPQSPSEILPFLPSRHWSHHQGIVLF